MYTKLSLARYDDFPCNLTVINIYIGNIYPILKARYRVISECPRRQIYLANQNISIIHIGSPKLLLLYGHQCGFTGLRRFQSTGTIRKKKPRDG